jgi:hypothetical protein
MNPENDPLAEFRQLVSRRARQSAVQWDDSRRLIDKDSFPSTLERLVRLVEDTELPPAVKDALRAVFRKKAHRVQDLDGAILKTLTGFPPTKALRALCLYFGMIAPPAAQWPVPRMTGDQVAQWLRHTDNPFDLLLESDIASVLDLGAGDLTFASELMDLYLPKVRRGGRPLVLHCLDRLHPQSKLGGPLHPESDRVRALRDALGTSFAFFGNQDMFDLHDLDDQGKLAPRYTIVTCWAPATPTFAYEPTRLNESVIAEHLRSTKGSYRRTRFEGEPALEVQHGERALLFPAWKFDIRGPLALLNLAAARGSLCVFGAVDAQVFWETISQLLEDGRYRPPDRPFTSTNLPDIFGEIYKTLDRMAIGESIDLAELGALRRVLPPTGGYAPASFRCVRIRRGATFEGVPASSTARKFSSMAEEPPPWFLVLVPA